MASSLSYRIDRSENDPWEGRLDGYCYECALTRCDAYPGECGQRANLQPLPEDVVEVIVALADAEVEALLAEQKPNPMKGFGW